tara:strand:- start:2104 stop:2292 length:189 start_codon:yes stop_codon:yes gene_type:complete
MKLTIKTQEFEIKKVPFENTTDIIIYDYDVDIEEMKSILLELGAKTHKNKRLHNWYCKNSED